MKRFFVGILLGAGAILPGISSGVICVILGLYDKLIDAVLGIFKDFKKNFKFLFPIALGGIIGVFFVGNILKVLFERFPKQTSYCFMGLILGSIPLLVKKINSERQFKLRYLLFALISFIIGYILVVLEGKINLGNSTENISIISLIISGFLMSIGVVVPGISNTLILMCIGVYPIYINAISAMNLSVLIPMGIGLAMGGLTFICIIKFLLDKFYMQTYYSIIGFTLGSVLILYFPLSFDLTGLISVILFVVGFCVARKLER